MSQQYIDNFLFFTPLILLVTGIFFILLGIISVIKKRKRTRLLKYGAVPLKQSAVIITSKDIRAIAGDDVISTQLDLARAYVEVGKKKIAKQILQHVQTNGDVHQQKLAQQLMASL